MSEENYGTHNNAQSGSYFSAPDPNYPGPRNYQIPAPGREPKRKPALRGLFFAIGLTAGLLFGILILVLVLRLPGMRYRYGSSAVDSDTLRRIDYIHSVMEEQFLFDMDEADTSSGIIKGYMNSFGDPYTVYYTPEEYRELMESMNGTFSGIGVLVQKDPVTGYILVVRPYESSPAYAAGIREEDLITEVEGEDIAELDLDIAVSKIRGEEGSSVHLTVYRPSTAETFEVDIVRATIRVETVTHKMLDGGIGYISMDSFDGVTYGQYMEAFYDLKAQGMKALVVDIRSNGGGLLDSVTAILDEMLPEGIITYTETKEGKQDTIYSDADCVLDVPMAVLVNGYSASASEIFTGALQDYKKAVIVGTQTFGKGIVQSIMGMDDGSAIKLTTSRYFTPNGVCIHGVGITPDIVVEPGEGEEDLQLQAAVDALMKELD